MRKNLLFPLLNVELLKASVAQHFQLVVRLAQLLLQGCVGLARLPAHRVLVIGLVPLRITLDSVEPSQTGGELRELTYSLA